jgi:signal transduction histidine kinase
VLQPWITRARELDDYSVDALLAVAFMVWGVLEAFLSSSSGESRPLTALAAIAISSSLVWRRRRTPVAILVLVAGAVLAMALDTFLFDSPNSPFALVLLLSYTVGRYETGARMWGQLILVALTVIIAILASGGTGGANLIWIALFLGGPALAGRALRNRALFQREMRDKADRLEAERELRAERAVEEERASIAAELQAIVANGVSAMVVQAEAVPRLLHSGEQAQAARSLAVIEETGRDALAEMRRLLGVLRRVEDGPALAPQPTLARADALLARARAAGLHTGLHIEGAPLALSPGIDLAAYRVLEEGLSSALRAPGASQADVSIVYGENAVLVKVRDDRDGAQDIGAVDLGGLRDRVGLYGGVLRAQPSESGQGFELEARLPAGGAR